jgi:hypothetical protein
LAFLLISSLAYLTLPSGDFLYALSAHASWRLFCGPGVDFCFAGISLPHISHAIPFAMLFLG